MFVILINLIIPFHFSFQQNNLLVNEMLTRSTYVGNNHTRNVSILKHIQRYIPTTKKIKRNTEGWDYIYPGRLSPKNRNQFPNIGGYDPF